MSSFLFSGGGGGSVSMGSTITSGTTGSILFIGAAAALSQDNANLFWDDASNILGLQTAAPTHTLTIGNGGKAAAVAVYNTADQVTNYERFTARWSSNVAQLISDKGGTGTSRALTIGTASAGTVGEYLTIGAAGASIGFTQGAGSITVAGYTAAKIGAATYTTTSGAFIGCLIEPTINAGGTSSIVGLRVNYVEAGSGVGSGGGRIAEFQNTSTTWMYISNTGKMGFHTSNTQTTVGAAGAGSALPATPTAYVKIEVGGDIFVIPYYASS